MRGCPERTWSAKIFRGHFFHRRSAKSAKRSQSVRGEVVATPAHVIPPPAGDERCFEGRHRVAADRRVTEEAEDGRRLDERQELAARIGPQVFVGARDVDRARRDQRQQHVLIDRQLGDARVETLVGRGEPVREGGVDALHGLAVPAPAQGGSAFARFVRHHQREPRILGRGPERRLAAARVAYDRHARGIDPRLLREVVHGAAGAPPPGRQRAPGVGRRLSRGGCAIEERHRAGAEGVLVVRRDLAVVERGHGVAAGDELLRGPEAGFHGSRGICVRNGAVVDEQEHRRAARRVGQEQRELELMRSLALAALDPDAAQRGRARHGARVLLEHGEGHVLRWSGRAAVDVVAEEAEDLLASGWPLRGGRDAAVPPCQGIRQRGRRHARFVVVDARSGRQLGDDVRVGAPAASLREDGDGQDDEGDDRGSETHGLHSPEWTPA